LNNCSWISCVDNLEICSRSQSGETSLLGVIKNFAYAYFDTVGHHQKRSSQHFRGVTISAKTLITAVKLVILDELLIFNYVLRGVVVQDISYNDV
jgi:hypothetical protein